ncbi:MAG: DinB family protein [Chloroflexi bacterium]|nr:DinB family protein [Chloroflexota bacterium]
MLNFSPVREKTITIAQLAATVKFADLKPLTNEMIDLMLKLIKDCVDADVVFAPNDPNASDEYAEKDGDKNAAWTLGHVIVHTTASAEESAAMASELARGVEHHGRSRSEVAWESITTIAQCRHRLEESRRMRLASLELWPDQPHLDNTYQPNPTIEPINAINRFIRGLSHDDSHLKQIEEIVRQARAARG